MNPYTGLLAGVTIRGLYTGEQDVFKNGTTNYALEQGINSSLSDNWYNSAAHSSDGVQSTNIASSEESVARWSDQSGNGAHLTASAGQRPYYYSHPTPHVRFYPGGVTGAVFSEILIANGSLGASALMGTQNVTIIACVRPMHQHDNISNGGSDASIGMICGFGTAAHIGLALQNGSPVHLVGGTGSTPTKNASGIVIPTNKQIIAMSSGATNTKFWCGQRTSTIASVASAGSQTVLRVGQGVSGLPFSGDIFELMVIEGQAADADITAARAVMAARQGVNQDPGDYFTVAGDSLSMGFATADIFNQEAWPRLMDHMIGGGGQVGIFNRAISGRTIFDFVNNFDAYLLPCVVTGKRNHLIVCLGTNDRGSYSRTPAQMIADEKALIVLAKAAGFLTVTVCNVIPRLLSSGNAAFQTDIATFNTAMAADAVTPVASGGWGADYFVNLNAKFTVSTNTAVATSSKSNYQTRESAGTATHITWSGSALIASTILQQAVWPILCTEWSSAGAATYRPSAPVMSGDVLKSMRRRR